MTGGGKARLVGEAGGPLSADTNGDETPLGVAAEEVAANDKATTATIAAAPNPPVKFVMMPPHVDPPT